MLAAGPEIPLDSDSGRRSFEIYKAAPELNGVVGKALDDFDRLGAFDPPLR